MKKRVFHLVEKGHHGSRINSMFDGFIMVLIVLNVLAIILDTVPSIHGPLEQEFHYFEVVSVIIFTIEYLLRLYVSDLTHPSNSRLKSALKFIFSGYGIIDILAIVPFYLPIFFAVDMRVIRLLRLLRFARLFKIGRYNKSLNILFNVLHAKRMELSIIGFASLVVLVISSTLIYYVEHDAQPDMFPSIAASFYWSISTVTALGYGDVYPITNMGKFLASIVSVLGIALFAIPTGIISTGFFELRTKKSQKCPHCGEDIYKHKH